MGDSSFIISKRNVFFAVFVVTCHCMVDNLGLELAITQILRMCLNEDRRVSILILLRQKSDYWAAS